MRGHRGGRGLTSGQTQDTRASPGLLLAAGRPIREETLYSGQPRQGWGHCGTNGPLVEGGQVKRVVAQWAEFMGRPWKHLSSTLVALL